MKINVFSLIFYFIGSILGILLAVFFVWFGDFEQLSLQWVIHDVNLFFL